MIDETPKKKVFLIVHGIGDQIRFATADKVARQVVNILGDCDPAAFSYGNFHDHAEHTRNGHLIVKYSSGTQSLEFREIFWADIARQFEQNEYYLQDSQSWAGTIADRVIAQKAREAAREATQEQPEGGKKSQNCRKHDTVHREVLRDLIATVGTLESVFTVAGLRGKSSFELKRLLDAFLGDVQQFTEFRPIRELILGRFDETLDAVGQDESADVYIVSHSEGSVVSFLGLMRRAAVKPDCRALANVKGFVTLGSPIGKHFRFWPELWAMFDQNVVQAAQQAATADEAADEAAAKQETDEQSQAENEALAAEARQQAVLSELEFRQSLAGAESAIRGGENPTPAEIADREDRKIPWLNVYDYSDPIGFRIGSFGQYDSVVRHVFKRADEGMNDNAPRSKATRFQKLATLMLRIGPEVESRDFVEELPINRYVLPGAAHNRYWGDENLFRYILNRIAHVQTPRTETEYDDPAKLQKELHFSELSGALRKNWVNFSSAFLTFCVPLIILLFGVTQLMYMHWSMESSKEVEKDGDKVMVEHSTWNYGGEKSWSLTMFGTTALGLTALFGTPMLASRLTSRRSIISRRRGVAVALVVSGCVSLVSLHGVHSWHLPVNGIPGVRQLFGVLGIENLGNLASCDLTLGKPEVSQPGTWLVMYDAYDALHDAVPGRLKWLFPSPHHFAADPDRNAQWASFWFTLCAILGGTMLGGLIGLLSRWWDDKNQILIWIPRLGTITVFLVEVALLIKIGQSVDPRDMFALGLSFILFGYCWWLSAITFDLGYFWRCAIRIDRVT